MESSGRSNPTQPPPGSSEENWSSRIRSEEMEQKMCKKRVKSGLEKDPVVRFMVEALEKAGCPVPPNAFQCAPSCTDSNKGSLTLGKGIKLCSNYLVTTSSVHTTMVHELIHAFDHCRAKVDWTNLQHHACSEIRAASLSGDCNAMQEWSRGHLSIASQHKACVRRRAQLSVEANPYCPSEDAARLAVNAVFDSCYDDTAPFDHHP